ncbi:O-antigen ligase family protein [Desulfotalea psychrophila]|uniref:Related to polysaccharide transport proteins n=1 Tax=Desulfotalea psychrophila (strain LSv54 / DSM 12343) TaxID=177439 RepID=Q6AIA1_DESPS|nr:O-antigen ligase family protein [Desulfotalea psychrophila]CAG37946.1 related to polysaccharide transport proteins [Desulfotalea psychrophila LSv54]
MNRQQIYDSLAMASLFALLLFAPLARGSVSPWAQSTLQILVIITSYFTFLKVTSSNRALFIPTPLFYPILALILWTLLSFALSPLKGVGVDALMLLFTYILLYYSVIHLIDSRKKERMLVCLLIGLGIFLSIFGFFKMLGYKPFPWWDYLQHDTFITSTYGNHNHLAGYLEMVIPLSLCLFLTRTRRGVSFFALLLISLILLAAHIATLSRGGWLALALSLLFMATVLLGQKRFRAKKLLLLIISFTLLLSIFILAGSDILERLLSLTDQETVAGLNGRSHTWQGVYKMIAAHPFIGSGPGSFATIFTQFQLPGTSARFYYAHNDYLQFIAELGLPVVLIILWALLTVAKQACRKIKEASRQTWGFTLAALAGLLAIACHSSVDFNLHIPANALIFTVLISLVGSGPKQIEKSKGGVA